MNSTRIFSLILLLFSCTPLLAQQELTMRDFRLSQNELINIQDTVLDLNRKPCALLKIQMLDELESVQGNVRKIVNRGNEKWVYISDGTHQLRIQPKNHLPIEFDLKGKDYGIGQFESNRVYIMKLVEEQSASGAKTTDRAYLRLLLTPKDALVTIDGQSLNVDPEEGALTKVLKFGKHIIEARARGYLTYIDTINFQTEQTLHINLQRQANPTVTIRSTTPGAAIYVNDTKRGTGECSLELSPDDYFLKVVCEGYQTWEQTITVTEQSEQLFKAPALKPLLGSLNVDFKPIDSKLIVDGRQRGTTPTIIDLPIGIHSVVISKEGYKVYANNNVKIETGRETHLSGRLEKAKPEAHSSTLLRSTCGYVQASFQAGSLMGVDISAGGYISNFNVEASYVLGMAKSEDIYWNPTTANASSVLCTYKPTAFGLRLGYGIAAGRSLRLTPQAGLMAVNIKCSDGDSKGNATSATIGLRSEYAVAPHFTLFATPEVAFAVSKSDVYGQLVDVSSKIKSWTNGFNIRIGLCVSF